MERINPPEELKLSSWCKCKVLDMMTLVFWFLVLPTCHGHLILPLGEGLKEEFISPYQNTKLDWECSRGV